MAGERKQILFLEKLANADRAVKSARDHAQAGNLDGSLQRINDAGSYLAEALALGEELRG